MLTNQTRSIHTRWRKVALISFIAIVVAVLVIKEFNDNFFESPIPLELNGQPALIFFTLSEGCTCQMKVVQAAEAQLAGWSVAPPGKISLIRVDFDRRPDLDRQYGVARAPALVLLDSQGRVAWKQDVGLSDETPLDLDQAQKKIETLMQNR
jgi:hypothetical protein